MKTVINDLKQHKIFILFVIFWILIILAFVNYGEKDLKMSNANKELIQTNYQEIMRKDSAINIMLKNDSIIIDKLEKLSKK